MDAFRNNASILNAYRVLDAVPLNSAPCVPLQPAHSALHHTMHTLPLPGTPTTTLDLAHSTLLPATGPVPVPALEELLNNALCTPFWALRGTQFTQPMLCNMALNTHAQHLHPSHTSKRNAHVALLALANGAHTPHAHTCNMPALDANMFPAATSFAPAPVPVSATAPAPTTAAPVAAHSEHNYFVEFVESAASTHKDFGCLLNFCCSVSALCGPEPDQRKPDLCPEHLSHLLSYPPHVCPPRCLDWPLHCKMHATATHLPSTLSHARQLARTCLVLTTLESCHCLCRYQPSVACASVLCLTAMQRPCYQHQSPRLHVPTRRPTATLFCVHHCCLRATTTPTWRFSHCRCSHSSVAHAILAMVQTLMQATPTQPSMAPWTTCWSHPCPALPVPDPPPVHIPVHPALMLRSSARIHG
jgi:hypothetical protein